MNSWYAKLPDWQIGVTWLAVTTVAGVIYFVPASASTRAIRPLGRLFAR